MRVIIIIRMRFYFISWSYIMSNASRQQNITFDGVGYVNNRGGFSRYWGVSFFYKDEHARRLNQKKIRVIVTDPSGQTGKHDLKAGFELNEHTAASIAAYFFEKIQKYLKTNKFNPFRKSQHEIVVNKRMYLVNLFNNEIKFMGQTAAKNTVTGKAAPYKAPESLPREYKEDPVITLDDFTKQETPKKAPTRSTLVVKTFEAQTAFECALLTTIELYVSSGKPISDDTKHKIKTILGI